MIMQKCLLPKTLTSFANYPLSFMSTTRAKKNIRQLNSHRSRQPLSQLSSAVLDITSPVKLIGNLAPRFLC